MDVPANILNLKETYLQSF